jgi:hypothetical protein
MLHFKYLKLQITALEINATCFFALHKCGSDSTKRHQNLVDVFSDGDVGHWSRQGMAKFNAAMKINCARGRYWNRHSEPTARHAADLGIIPVVIEDACGAGHADAAQRSCEASCALPATPS